MKQENKCFTKALLSVIGTLLLIAAVITMERCSRPKTTFPVTYVDTIPGEKLSLDDSIRSFISFINVAHPDIVYAQAVLESGNFTSNNFKKRNNLFGMKRATRRANMNRGEGEWSSYDMWEYSIIDYALYQATYMTDDSGKRLSREEYLDKLGRSYASDPKYVQKVDKLSELWAKEKD